MRDQQHGGYFWSVGIDGKPRDPRKLLYGEAFVIYALVEFHRAGGGNEALDDAIALYREIQKHAHDREHGGWTEHFERDWTPVTDPRSAGLSYGHNIEFAGLMIRAEEVLGRTPSWDHFFSHLDHTLRHGTDHQRGGIYNRGTGNGPASDTDKIWWVQAEGIAALTDALRRSPLKDQAKAREPYSLALQQLLAFTSAHMTDPKTGVWLDTVRTDGTPKATGLAHSWKANYHDLRAVLKFIKAFEHH